MWWLKRSGWSHYTARLIMLFAVLGYILLPTAPVWANPTGEQVVGGAASFERQGNTLTVNQSTDRLAVNWQDFSIAAGEHTHFNMPSSTSAALNRVLGGNPSQIYGTLSANGILYLVNPSGIFVGPSGVVNAASFVGSTLDIDPQQFMRAGQEGVQLHGDSYAPIVNQGNIRAEKGDVFLIAQKVENRGAITAPNGKAALVGTGEKTEVVLHEVGGSGFAVRVTQLQGAEALGSNHNLPDGEELLNEGEIAAAQAELSASGNIYALAIKNTGTIRAKAVVAQADGTVRLDGGSGDVLNAGSLIARNAGDPSTAAGGQIEVTGRNVTASPESIITAAGGEQGGDGGRVKIDSADTTIVQGKVGVTALSADGKGGKVELVGKRVGLFDGAKVDASGGAGGGRVLVGGDYLGGQTPKPELKDLAKLEADPVKNSKATVMAKTAEIRADATANGDGGKIILWSDEYTGFYGQLFAQGGMGGGDGGFIETSSKSNLQVLGSVNAGSTLGKSGQWLLDPTDVSITSGTTGGGSFSGANWSFDTPNPATATINVNSLISALSSGDVTISTASTSDGTGTISVNADIASSSGNDLTLLANSTISVGGRISLTGGGSLKLASSSLSAGDINVQQAITAFNLDLTGAAITINALIFTANNLTVSPNTKFLENAGQSLSVGGDFVLNNFTAGTASFGNGLIAGGRIAVTNPGKISLTGGQFQGASITLKTTSLGDISLAGDVSALSGTVNIEALGAFDLAAGQRISSTDNIFLTGRTGLNLAGAVQGAADKFISLNGGSGSITRSAGQGSSASSITLGSGGIAMNAGGGIDASMDVTSLGAGSVTAYGGSGDVTLNVFNSVSNVNVNAQSTSGSISVTADGDLTVVFRDNKSFSAGKDVTLTVNGSGNIVLGNNNIIAGGALNVNRGTGTIFFGLNDSGRVVGYEVDAPTQNYNGPVVLNAETQLRGDSALRFSRSTTVNAPLTIDSNGSVSFSDQATDFVTLAGNATAGLIGDITFNGNTAVTFNAAVVGSPVFGRPGGLNFQDGDNVTGVVRLNAYAGTPANPIGFFAKEGGTVEFSGPGGLTTPAINLIPGGRLVLLGTTLSLATDTFLATDLDLTLSGAINSFNDTDAIGFRVATPGLFIFNGTGAGGSFPLRTFWADTSAGAGDILVNAPVNVRPMGKNPVTNLPYVDHNGTIELSAGGSLVIDGNLTTDVYNTLVGNITLRAALNENHRVTDNIQVGDITFLTRGGSINFGTSSTLGDGNVFFVSSASDGTRLDTFADNAGGDITFQGLVDGSSNRVQFNAGTGAIRFNDHVGQISPMDFNITASGGVEFAQDVLLGSLGTIVNSISDNVQFGGALDKLAGVVTMNLGERTATFEGQVGRNNPFGMTITASQGITFMQPVVMGGAFDLTANNDASGDGIVFKGTVDGNQALTLRGATTNVELGDTLGGSIPLGAITVVSGAGTITLGGDVYTSGGVMNFGKAVSLNANSTISTTSLNSLSGANITFQKEVAGGFDLVLNAGTGGALQFGNGGSTFTSLSILSAGGGVGVNGVLKASGSISIVPGLNPVVNGQDISLESISGSISLLSGIFGQSNTTRGSDVVLKAENGVIDVGGNITLTGASLVANAPGYRGGNLTVSAQSVSLKGVTSLGGSDNEPLSPGSGDGGEVKVTASSGNISMGTITTSGGFQGVKGTGGTGGNVSLKAFGTISVAAVDTSGGNSAEGLGGNAGSITFESSSDLLIPSSILATGGTGSGTSGNQSTYAGRGGLVTMRTKGSGSDVAFGTATLDLLGDMDLRVQSAGNIILGVVNDFTNPTRPVSGTILSLNTKASQDAAASTVSDLPRRGSAIFEFGMENPDAVFFSPSSGVVSANGGLVLINRVNASAPTVVGGGAITLGGGIYTSAPNLDGGQVLINTSTPFAASLGGDSTVLQLGAVNVLGSINTAGGTPSEPRYGRSGGSISMAGTTVSFRQINTSGSASLATSIAPAFGGAGGNVTITAGTIQVRSGTTPADGYLAIDASGGTGRGAGNADGGGGGNILFNGDVLLNSGDTTRTTVILSSLGGVFAGNGSNGVGGDITFNGKVTGTETSSNILDLRYGSGIATLGDGLPAPSNDKIILGTLITAADDSRSTGGTLRINGELDLGTLTTYARGYAIEINGGGVIDNAVTFKNTGDVALGNSSLSTTFTGGLDASLPSLARLQGLIVSGNTLQPGSSTPLSFGVASLVGNTVLNSNGSNVSLGRVDGPFDLTFAAGIGSGVVDISSTVGANARLDMITISQGITQPVLFRDVVFATDMVGGLNTAITFLGNVDLAGGAQFQGLTTLDNSLYESQSSTLEFLSVGAVDLNQLVLASGPIRLTGNGNYTISGAVTGPQNLKLAGAGTKLFASTVGSATAPVGSGVAGIEQADGSGTVTFQGDVFASGASSFGASLVLSGMTFTSADRVDFGGDLFDDVILSGSSVTLAGLGVKNFNGTVDSTTDLTQGASSGRVIFQNNVTSSGSSTFNGEVEFAGLVFNSGGDVTWKQAAYLSGGQVTFTGTGSYTSTASSSLDGNQNLILSGIGTKSFSGALGSQAEIGTGSGAAIAISGGSVTFGALRVASGISSSANTFFTGDTQVLATGDTDSSFAGTVGLAGVTFTSGLAVSFGNVTLSTGSSGANTTLAGSGSYQMLGNLQGSQTGVQSLLYTSAGDLAISGSVGTALNRLSGVSQSNTAGAIEFQGNVYTAGTSAFAGNVLLNGLTGLTFDANGGTTFSTVQLTGGNVLLTGTGAQSVSGALSGNNTNLALDGAGEKIFSTMTDLGDLRQESTAGMVTLGGNVKTTGSVEMNAVTKISGLVQVDSGSSKQSYTTTLLAGDLTTTTTFSTPGTDAVSFGLGGVSGTGNLAISGVSSVGIGNTVANTGTFRLNRDGVINLGSGGILNDSEMALIRSGGGAIFNATGGSGSINANSIVANTALTLEADQNVTATDVSGSIINLQSRTAVASATALSGSSIAVLAGTEATASGISGGSIRLQAGTSATATSVDGNTLDLQAGSGLATANSVNLSGALNLSSASSGLSFGGNSRAAIVNLDGTSVSGLSTLAVPRIGTVSLTAGGLDYRPSGNLATAGRIRTSGEVVLAPSGNFVNEFFGNPFASPSTRILTRDFFSYPQNAGVPGLTAVYGVSGIDQVGPNQIGVTLPLLAGSAGPYILQFTTGTGQPYILATQNAVLPVLSPVAYSFSGAFPARVSYNEDEIEMMTPEERSAYQASQREQSARVIFQRNNSQQQETGVSPEGGSPQANTPKASQVRPTAQVPGDAKPTAYQSPRDRNDTTQMLRLRPVKSVALHLQEEFQGVLENERMTAEVQVGAAPVVSR